MPEVPKTVIPLNKESKSWYTGICGSCKVVLEAVEFTGTLNCPNCHKEVKI